MLCPLHPCPSALVRSQGTTLENRVPSLRFFTTSTASSTARLQVCCTLLPVMRFMAFWPQSVFVGPVTGALEERRLPSSPCSHPSKVPSSAADWSHLPSFPPYRWINPSSNSDVFPFPATHLHPTPYRSSISRFCSAFESVTPHAVSSILVPWPSVGFVPLRGFFPHLAHRKRNGLG